MPPPYSHYLLFDATYLKLEDYQRALNRSLTDVRNNRHADALKSLEGLGPGDIARRRLALAVIFSSHCGLIINTRRFRCCKRSHNQVLSNPQTSCRLLRLSSSHSSPKEHGSDGRSGVLDTIARQARWADSHFTKIAPAVASSIHKRYSQTTQFAPSATQDGLSHQIRRPKVFHGYAVYSGV